MLTWEEKSLLVKHSLMYVESIFKLVWKSSNSFLLLVKQGFGVFLVFLSSEGGVLCVLVGCAPEAMQDFETSVVESLRAFLVLFWGRWRIIPDAANKVK